MEQQFSPTPAAPPQEPAIPLKDWMEQQYRFSATAIQQAISATEIVKTREKFGQRIVPKRGSVLASPELAAYDPDPDYFFHWLRDSAVVIDAVRVLVEQKTLGPEGAGHFCDFVTFSLELNRLSGPDHLSQSNFRAAIDPGWQQFTRSDADIATVSGDRVLGDTRFNPDGTLDVLGWGRPQHDGPATRALTTLRHWRSSRPADRNDVAAMTELLQTDLEFIHRHWHEPSFDIWEEEPGHHYYTRLVQHAALLGGSGFMDEIGDADAARRYAIAAGEILVLLDRHWSTGPGFYTSRIEGETVSASKALDISVILAVLHAGLKAGTHSILDPKVQATQQALEELFAAEYEINRSGAGKIAPAMGRYRDDTYYSGGAYFFSTLGAAEFYYTLADRLSDGGTLEVTSENEAFLSHVLDDAPASQVRGVHATQQGWRGLVMALVARGDAFMATARAYIPESGEISEQFDRNTGEQTSAKNLAWSYGAFITAYATRRSVMARIA